MNKLILDLCGGSGAWSKPYKEAGYEVINITLPDYDVWTYQPPPNVYGILAAPPCTMFSLARTRAKTPRDLRGGMKNVESCLRIIWEARYQQKLAFWVLENPTGILRQFLGKPVMTWQPYEFGDPYTKRTDLWGYFNLPKKTNSIDPPNLKSISELTSSTQSAKRAITPPGFANAFFKANK